MYNNFAMHFLETDTVFLALWPAWCLSNWLKKKIFRV